VLVALISDGVKNIHFVISRLSVDPHLAAVCVASSVRGSPHSSRVTRYHHSKSRTLGLAVLISHLIAVPEVALEPGLWLACTPIPVAAALVVMTAEAAVTDTVWPPTARVTYRDPFAVVRSDAAAFRSVVRRTRYNARVRASSVNRLASCLVIAQNFDVKPRAARASPPRVTGVAGHFSVTSLAALRLAKLVPSSALQPNAATAVGSTIGKLLPLSNATSVT